MWQLTIQHEIEKTNLAKTIEALETEKVSLKQQLDDEKRKIEDLVFNYEEESITKSEIQVSSLREKRKWKKYRNNHILVLIFS